MSLNSQKKWLCGRTTVLTLLWGFGLLLDSASVAADSQDSLAQQVTIYRDEYGVPHIVGDTLEATFYGYGYAQAEDHLERMMLQYRDAQGRRTEVLGFEALGEGYLQFIPYEYRWDGDFLQRLLRTWKGVIERRRAIDPDVYGILDAFARGINSYITQNRAQIPDWIDRVTAEDIEALERSHYFRFYSIHDALSKLSDKPYSFPNLGSNHFAIAPSKSATGRIIHVEHTHMPWANRFQNYEAHLVTPGRLNAGGISWFGSPFFLDGFNDKITWSATYNSPNIADVYEEKLNPENWLQYAYEGGWRDVRVEQETFKIKGPAGVESLTLSLYFTHHGPIVKFDRQRNRAYAVRLPNFEGVDYSAGMFRLMTARNLEDFQNVLRRYPIPRWNFLYSDAQNIYWIHNGAVARRTDGYDWRKPVPGWVKETEWGDYLPLESHPQLLNPASGFLQNCNNPPWVATRNSGLKPLDPVPYYLQSPPKADAGEEVLNTRAERLFDVLGRDRKFTLEEIKSLAVDTYVVPADVIVPLLKRALTNARQPVESRVREAVHRLLAWDRRSSIDSVAYTILHFWGKSYQEHFSAAKFSRFRSLERRQIDLDSAEEQAMALTALRAGLNRIETLFGNVEVPWGQINVVLRGESFAMDGNSLYGVLHPDYGPEQDNGRIHCNDGWGHLMVVMEGEPKEIWTLLPYGQSEDPASKHYNDQTKLHSQGQMKRFWFTPQEILDRAESVRGDRARIQKLMR
ncbi:MAG: penicillin acylase family protein [Acidobacteriota bacterium]